MKTTPHKAKILPSGSELAEVFRLMAASQTDAKKKSEFGQFLTPQAVAGMMAEMTECQGGVIRILDAGAGAGSLFAAAVGHLCRSRRRLAGIHVTAYELDNQLIEPLGSTLAACEAECRMTRVAFTAEVIQGDFLEMAAKRLCEDLFHSNAAERFDLAILNPPYYKINGQSKTRTTLRSIGIETSNIYTGFLAVTVKLLKPGGELIAITPRSFCNGTYFRAFRKWFLNEMTLCRIHSFHSRQEAFRDDDVLQETVIFRAVKEAAHGCIVVTSSTGPNDPDATSRIVDYARVVRPDDPQHFIRIPTDDLADQIAERMAACRTHLADLGLTVSTGRVVDFRRSPYLRDKPVQGTAPLIWPTHFDSGYISWPKNGTFRKPEAIVVDDAIADQLVPNEPYVLVRRFSAKEEPRRLVAAVYDPRRLKCEAVGFENHLNYFHRNGRGIGMKLARGLAAFLNSTILDLYFRQFSGHTQVNATDLRNIRYPTREQLERIGSNIRESFPDQAGVDALIARELFDTDSVVVALHQHITSLSVAAARRGPVRSLFRRRFRPTTANHRQMLRQKHAACPGFRVDKDDRHR